MLSISCSKICRLRSWMYVCGYSGIMRNIYNTNKKNGSVRDYTLKYLAKRKTISKKTPSDQR